MTEIIISLEALMDIAGKEIKLSKYDEVVTRCKDCKWYYGDYCGGFGDGAFTPEDGFCHNAERKEE